MRVCVIGAGPSGLTTVKQLLDEGHDVTCFERNDNIGGIWYRKGDDKGQMKAYDNLVLTISMKLMSFSDFMHKGDRTFTDHKGYLSYLEDYTKAYGLRHQIIFNSTVDEIVHEDDNSWSLTVTDADGKKTSHSFEAVAVCSGPFKTPNTKIPEIENFSGEVIHSSQYRNNKGYAGKKVLILGLAESGADIVREISDVTDECTVSIRSRSFLVPRLVQGKFAIDMLTTRAYHYEMWERARTPDIEPQLNSFTQNHWLLHKIFYSIVNTYGLLSISLANLSGRLNRKNKKSESKKSMNNLGQPAYPSKIDMFTENSKENIDFINEWNQKSHHGEGNWSQRIIYCKNISFVPNVINKKLDVQDSGIDHIDGNTVHFKDSTVKEFDTIVLCTGFLKDYSIFKNITVKDNNVRNLYKHAFHPDHNGRLAMIGFLRPITGGIPICSEMQARYFAQLCSNKLKLPSNLNERIQKEKEWEEKWICLSPRHNEAMPSPILFMDSIAKEIGCHVPFHKLILRPKLMVKLWFYSFNQSCYRLMGDHHMYDEALKEVMDEKLPLNKDLFMKMLISLSMKKPSMHPKNLDFKHINTD